MQEAIDRLTYFEVKYFLTLPDERLLIAKRQHWIVLLLPIMMGALLCLVLVLLVALLYLIKAIDLFSAVLGVLIAFAIFTTYVANRYIDWRFHLYVLTTRKILEVTFTPIFSHVINDVFLDQVRTTEIDINVSGVINEFVNVGDVVILFDRPSHEETMVLRNIEDPRGTGILISDALENIMHNTPIWFQPREPHNAVKFNEEVYTRRNK